MTPEEKQLIINEIIETLSTDDYSFSLDSVGFYSGSIDNPSLQTYILPLFQDNGNDFKRLKFSDLMAPIRAATAEAKIAKDNAVIQTEMAKTATTNASDAAKGADEKAGLVDGKLTELQDKISKIATNEEAITSIGNQLNQLIFKTVKTAEYENPEYVKNINTLYFCFEDDSTN